MKKLALAAAVAATMATGAQAATYAITADYLGQTLLYPGLYSIPSGGSQEVGDGGGIAAMLPNPQRQGLEPLNELEGVEGADGGAHIAQHGDPSLDDIGDRPQRLDRFGPDRAVVARVGLVQR